MSCDAVFMTILTVARLVGVSYDPGNTLDMVVYFPNDMNTPPAIELTFPGLQQGPDVPGIPFGGPTGHWFSNQGQGHLLSFNGLSSHATPHGSTISPEQPIVDVNGNAIVLTQLNNLFGNTVQKGDFFKASIHSEHIYAKPGLVEVYVGVGDIAWVALDDPSVSIIPVAGVGTAGPFTMDTLVDVINPASQEKNAAVDFFDGFGNPAARFEGLVPAAGTLTIPGSNLFPPDSPSISGSMQVTCDRCGVSSVWNVDETVPCDGPSGLDAAPLDEEPCGKPKNAGTAGVAAPKPGNILIFPQFADGSGGSMSLGGPSKSAVAASNNFDQTANITLVLCGKDGKELARKDVQIPPKNHISKFVAELFPGLIGLAFTGYLSSDVPVTTTTLKTDERGLPKASVDPIRINGEYFLPDGPFWMK